MLPPTYPTLACCAFPTQIIVIDDEPAVLDSLRFSLKMPMLMLSNSLQALEQLSAYQPVITDKLWLKFDQSSDSADGVYKQPLLMDVKKILSIKEMPERFNDISVVIVDYQMPDMDGLSLLNQLKEKPFKKILLTGKGSDALAVQAFNQDLIDCFLHKDDLALQEKMHEAINRLKQQYFIDLSKKTIELLAQTTPLFLDAHLPAFFYRKINSMDAYEFYLLDMNGSYLLKNSAGEKKHLLIHTSEYIDICAEHAKIDHATLKVIDSLLSKKAFPYFGEDKAYWQIEGKDWEQHLQPLNEIKFDKQSFYIAEF